MFYRKADKNSLKAKGPPVILFQTCIKGNLVIFSVILVTCLDIVIYSVRRNSVLITRGSERVKSETLLVTTIYFDYDKSTNQQLLVYCSSSDVHFVLSRSFFKSFMLQIKMLLAMKYAKNHHSEIKLQICLLFN